MNKAKILFAACLVAGMAAPCRAESSALAANDGMDQNDSTSVYQLSESIVAATKAPKSAPFAISELTRRQLDDFSRGVQELPYLFTNTPGVLAWGENGLGSGTSYMRIRGAGDSRINVTLDGVPLNSPEDQCVFWANMNSYASFLGGVQIQRGVGSSTNGDGAFGGSVALFTKIPSYTPSTDVSLSYGSYNSFKANLGFNSGLLGNHFILDGGFSFSRTDGYLHGTGGDGGNWILGLHYMPNDNLVIRYRNVGNVEHTGQAWNGVVAGNDDVSLIDGSCVDQATWESIPTGIRTYADMCKVGLGRFNNLYERLVTDEDGNFVKDAKGNYVTERYRMNNDTPWPKTTDNFIQDHNILSLAWRINEYWNLNASLHYTYGSGYYSEFRPQNKLKKFGISDIWSAKGKTTTDFVREKGLRQHTYGLVANAQFDKNAWHLHMGLNAQNFNGNHYGYLNYIASEQVEQALAQIAPWYADGAKHRQYYNSDAVKTDVSAFAKLTYNFTGYLDGFADLQYRFVRFRTWGINDKFITADGGSSKTGPWLNQALNIDKCYNFANPKLGLKFHLNGHNAYASFAMSGREPERNNFTDNGTMYPAPRPEFLFDYELGYSYVGKNFEVGAGLYFMDYKDQFVQTGQLSDIGENLTTNIAKSYRMGIELSAAYTPVKWFTIDGNLALSRNRILDFTEYVDNWDGDPEQVLHTDSILAFSPSVVGGFNATFRFLRGAKVVWNTNVVSRQYLDNSACKERSLPAYSFSNLRLGYTMDIYAFGIRSVDFGLDLGNIFNSHFAQSGWVYSAVGSGYTLDKRYTQIGFVPSAGITAMASVAIHF